MISRGNNFRESLKNKTKRGEVSINFPKNILENDKADGTSEENSIFEGRGVLPEIPFESLPEIGFALGLSVFSGFWALWEAFGKKAVFGDQEEEEEDALFLEGDEYGDDDESGDEPAAVTVARVADALLLDDLRKAALDRLVRCVDLASAASLVGVARDLTEDRLRRACREDSLRRGPDACRRAAGADVFDASLPPATHAGLRRLAALAASNPVCCGAALPDAREALAMLREALDDQAERLANADERQRLEADAPSAAYVLANIERQRAHVAFLRDFIVKQESEFVAGDRWTLGV